MNIKSIISKLHPTAHPGGPITAGVLDTHRPLFDRIKVVDDEIPGFTATVYADGHASMCLEYVDPISKERMYRSLGRYPDTAVDHARKRAYSIVRENQEIRELLGGPRPLKPYMTLVGKHLQSVASGLDKSLLSESDTTLINELAGDPQVQGILLGLQAARTNGSHVQRQEDGVLLLVQVLEARATFERLAVLAKSIQAALDRESNLGQSEMCEL